MQDRQLIIPDEIDKSIVRITTIGEAKEYRANGQTLLRYVQEHGLGIGTANQVMKAILLTEHKLGTMLNELAPHGGDGPSKQGVNLDSLGVAPWNSARWRKMAEIHPEDIRVYCDESTDIATRAGLLRLQTESITEPKEKCKCPICGKKH
jgi:hypothetical protein